MGGVTVTLMSSMAGPTLDESVERHVGWGIDVMDIKDHVFGKSVVDLDADECLAVKRLLSQAGLTLYCMSTPLFAGTVEAGKDYFADSMERLGDIARVAEKLEPSLIRVTVPDTLQRAVLGDAIAYVRDMHPWLLEMYRKAFRYLTAAAPAITVENGPTHSLLGSANEVREFFEETKTGESVGFTWDVQNMWECGTFPSLDVYNVVRPYLNYYHVKGGRSADGEPGALRWKSALDDASWPVAEITKQVVADHAVAHVCLNPSHGEELPGYSYSDVTARDLGFVRGLLRC